MSPLAVWDLFLLKFGLASPAARARQMDALWRGAGPSFAARALPRLVFVGAVLAGILLCVWLCLPFVALLSSGSTLARAADSLSSRSASSRAQESRAASTGRTAGSGQPESLGPGARAEIQRQHDAWQGRYGDATYRAELKPRVLREAFASYLDGVLRGNLSETPARFLYSMDAERVRSFSASAEASFQSDPLGPAPSVIRVDSGE